MGLLADIVSGFTGYRADVTFSDLDDRWYQPELGGIPPGGLAVTDQTLFLCGVVLAALRWRADIFSQAQPTVVRRLSKGRREEVPDHPVWRLLRNPNAWQTGVRWRHLNMVRAQLGNSYNRMIRVGGVPGELWPIEKNATMRVVGQRPDGSLVYRYTPPGKPPRDLGQEEVLHFRGFSTDGIEGLNLSTLIRNAVGIALLAEKHIATSLRKGARIAGLLVPEGDPGGRFNREELAKSVNETFSRPDQAGGMGVLPYGVKFQALSMDNQKAQLLELRDFQVGDILRFLGVPGVVVGYADKTATYASAEAFFSEAERCVLPWVVNFEAEEAKQLLDPDGDLRIKHNLDAVLRADTLKRYEALFKASGRAWITGNEARGTEDLDPIDNDPSMDQVAPPPNTNGTERGPAPGGSAAPPPKPRQGPKPAPTPTQDDEEQALVDRLRLSAVQAWTDIAARVVRREAADVAAAAARYQAAEPEQWPAWVARYYENRGAVLERALHLAPAVARAYADEHRDELLEAGVAAAERWVAPGAAAISKLAWLALGEDW